MKRFSRFILPALLISLASKAKQAIGKSCGGLTTKLHAACADERVAVSLSLSPGQSHDTTAFPAVWEGVPKSRWLDAAVMDKAYDSDDIRRFLEHQGVEAVIPPKSNRKMLYPLRQNEISNASKSGAVLLSNQRIPADCHSLRQTGQNLHGVRSSRLRFRRFSIHLKKREKA